MRLTTLICVLLLFVACKKDEKKTDPSKAPQENIEKIESKDSKAKTPKKENPIEQFEASFSLKEAEDFYDYAYPLVMMKISQDVMLSSPLRRVPAQKNKFIMFPKLAQPENTAVVLGNRNTLYCVGWVDVSEGPVLFEIPDMGRRYYVMPLIDAWTNTFKSLGSRTTGQDAQKYVLVSKGYSGNLPKGYQKIECPTSMVWITGRIQADDDKDAIKAAELQAQYILKPMDDSNSTSSYVPSFKAMQVKKPVPYSLDMKAAPFYDAFFEMLRHNSPAELDASFLASYPFMKNPPKRFMDLNGPDQERLAQALENREAYFLKIFYKGTEQKSAWDFKIEDMGDWGTNYYRRAYYAVWGIGANIPKDAVYGVSQLDSNLKQLDGQEVYKIYFPPEGTPEVGGFWSITAYDNEGYLEKNEENRYATGSNMPIRLNSDGSLELYMSSTKPKGVPNYNWIPTPKGKFKILFRMYWPKESILNGSYQLPTIEKIKAKS